MTSDTTDIEAPRTDVHWWVGEQWGGCTGHETTSVQMKKMTSGYTHDKLVGDEFLLYRR